MSTPRNRRAFPWRVVGIAAGALVLMFAVGYVIAVRVLFPPLPEPTTGIVVPKLTGLTVRDAEAQLRQIDLRVTDIIRIPDRNQEQGIIVAQSPLPGQQLRTAGAVRLGVSAGPPRVAVPDVVGFTLERATALLSSTGLQLEQQVEDSNRPAGTVVRTEPQAGVQVATPARIVVFVSSGPPPVPADTAPTPVDTLAVSASGTTL